MLLSAQILSRIGSMYVLAAAAALVHKIVWALSNLVNHVMCSLHLTQLCPLYISGTMLLPHLSMIYWLGGKFRA